MGTPIIVSDEVDEEIDALDPGSTFTLGTEGWEPVDYVAPGDDWLVQADGSFLSPDERTRRRISHSRRKVLLDDPSRGPRAECVLIGA